jgi:type 1 glutamine amidotransferase
MIKKLLLFLGLVLLTNTLDLQNIAAQNNQQSIPKINVLVFTKTVAFYHHSKPNAIKAFYEIAHKEKWQITFTEDSTFFTEKELKKYNVVVFLLTSGNNILNDKEKLALQKYVEGGGGFVGVHSATDTEYKWPWYEKLIGAHFTGHPPVHQGKLIIEDKNHMATKCFGMDTLIWTDEFYSFDRNPRKNSNLKILVSIDEKSYNIDENIWFKNVNIVMGDHPLIWCQNIGKGRSFITSLGHSAELYDNEMYRKHVTGAILWAAGKTDNGL